MHSNRMFTYLAAVAGLALVLGIACVRLAALLPFGPQGRTARQPPILTDGRTRAVALSLGRSP